MEIWVEHLQGSDRGITLVGLDRPEAKNALGRRLMTEFREALKTLAASDSARVVIVHSLVPGVFCAGAGKRYIRGARRLRKCGMRSLGATGADETVATNNGKHHEKNDRRRVVPVFRLRGLCTEQISG